MLPDGAAETAPPRPLTSYLELITIRGPRLGGSADSGSGQDRNCPIELSVPLPRGGRTDLLYLDRRCRASVFQSFAIEAHVLDREQQQAAADEKCRRGKEYPSAEDRLPALADLSDTGGLSGGDVVRSVHERDNGHERTGWASSSILA